MKAIACTLLLVTGFSLFFYNCYKVIAFLKRTKPENRFSNIPQRLKKVLIIAFGQKKLLQQPVAGLIHFFIFWGFLFFLLSVFESVVQAYLPNFILGSDTWFGGLFALIQDIFVLAVVVAVIGAIILRYVVKIRRLQKTRAGHRYEPLIILLMIVVVMVSLTGQNLTNPNVSSHHTIFFSVFGQANGQLAAFLHEMFWWLHIVTIFAFLNYLPYSKHFHIVTSIPNVYFSKLDADAHVLKPVDFESDEQNFGAADVNGLTWKQVLDGYTCTECGRCDDVCPAVAAGKSLSPRKIMMDIRSRSQELRANIGDNNTLLHNYIQDKEIWECTTCSSCQNACPVMIEHVDTVIDLRRNLVLAESNFPPELQTIFKNLEINGNPWGFSSFDRAKWAEGMEIPVMADDANHEFLFWVGCAGSYDARYMKVTKAFAEIMKIGGVDFAILGNEETCNGDIAKRTGNEYVSQEMISRNLKQFRKYGIKKIITGCPHCFNSLKTDFHQAGGDFEILFYTEILENLLKTAKIKLKKSNNHLITYHDSCYIGKYYNIFDVPRNILTAIPGVEIAEMSHNKHSALCCGAGGGMMFVEDTEGDRINALRSKEALDTKASILSTSCPFCMSMLNDGLLTCDKPDNLEIKDIAEIIRENIIL
jgi:Fe-S oxidoreductase